MIKIILSALNEAQNLQTLLPKIAKTMENLALEYEIIICIDGSNDNSHEIILAQKKYYPIRILQFLQKKGLGNAFRRIFFDLIENSSAGDIAISMDADNTHDAAQISEIVQYFQKNDVDLLILSRFCKDSKIVGFPLFRKIISKTTSILLRIFFGAKTVSGKKVKDYSSGYRAYKMAKLQELHKKYGKNLILEENFVYTCEILQKFAKNDAKIDEIALKYDYSLKIGESKLKFWQNFWKLLVLVARNGNLGVK